MGNIQNYILFLFKIYQTNKIIRTLRRLIPTFEIHTLTFSVFTDGVYYEYKAWCLNSSTGYMVNFDFYEGKNPFSNEAQHNEEAVGKAAASDYAGGNPYEIITIQHILRQFIYRYEFISLS